MWQVVSGIGVLGGMRPSSGSGPGRDYRDQAG
jgi:hypothetical protein